MKWQGRIRGHVKPRVAPHWGAWIEISSNSPCTAEARSHPTGVRGLKYLLMELALNRFSRTPLGCVD